MTDTADMSPRCRVTIMISMSDALETLLIALKAVCPPEQVAWLEQACACVTSADDPAMELTIHSAMAHRKLGDGQLPAPSPAIATACGELDPSAWPFSDVARTILILAAIGARPTCRKELVTTLFRRGDEAERAGIARALALLDSTNELKALILETGRANSRRLIGAVTLRNPYPAAHYTDAEFNQLVLKALFVGLPINQVMGLEHRANGELSRMCEDYYDERTAAHRSVPPDIWLALAPHASPRGEALLVAHLANDDPAHRYFAVSAVERRRAAHPHLHEVLAARLEYETDCHCLALLRQAL